MKKPSPPPWLSVLLSALTVACGSAEQRIVYDASPPDGNAEDSSPPDANSDDAGMDSATVDGGKLLPDPRNPNNHLLDYDCDGLSDRDEFQILWGGGMRTDPANPDSDGDGLLDGVEAGRTSSVDPACADVFVPDPERTNQTNPTAADTNNDGICDGPDDVVGVCTGDDGVNPMDLDSDGDGVLDIRDSAPNDPDRDGDGLCDGNNDVEGVCVAGEDRNGDGQVASTETDPDRIDTDCDGLVDGAGFGGWLGELDFNTDPLNADSDDDGLPDGLEVGVNTPPDPSCMGFSPDLDPDSTTDPLDDDSDGDGVEDGAEDTNQNGAVDEGEFDPNDPTDADDPVTQAACALDQLIGLDRVRTFDADLQVAVAEGTFDERLELEVGGDRVGQMAYDSVSHVAYVAVVGGPSAANADAEELALRATLDAIATLSTSIASTFTSWDGYPTVRSTHLSSGGGIKVRANAIARALLGNGVDVLPTAGDFNASGMRIGVQVIRRSPQTNVSMIALMPGNAPDASRFQWQDMIDGSAIGQFHDRQGTQCDPFTAGEFAALDILWAVDNSTSMGNNQQAVAAAAAGFTAFLNRASVNWRAAAVTSGFYDPKTTRGCYSNFCANDFNSQCRPFTSDQNQLVAWFTEDDTPGSAWFGAGGRCNRRTEEAMYGSQLILSDPASPGKISFLPTSPTPDNHTLRADTNLVVIYLGDADDQFYRNDALPGGIEAYKTFLLGLPVTTLTVGGILCPEDGGCGEAQRNPRVMRSVIRDLGGQVGDLKDIANIAPTIEAILSDAVSNSSTYFLAKDAISSTIKVAVTEDGTVGNCDTSDVPRSRSNGWDYAPRSRTVSFFGNCRPSPDSEVRVSYRYWIDNSPNPDPPDVCIDCGGCDEIKICNFERCECECTQQVSCPAGYVWSDDVCDCVCDAVALNCPSTHGADLDSCSCVCLPACGGCEEGFRCNENRCQCDVIVP